MPGGASSKDTELPAGDTRGAGRSQTEDPSRYT